MSLSNIQNLPAHERNVAMIPILLARNRASLSSLSEGGNGELVKTQEKKGGEFH